MILWFIRRNHFKHTRPPPIFLLFGLCFIGLLIPARLTFLLFKYFFLFSGFSSLSDIMWPLGLNAIYPGITWNPFYIYSFAFTTDCQYLLSQPFYHSYSSPFVRFPPSTLTFSIYVFNLLLLLLLLCYPLAFKVIVCGFAKFSLFWFVRFLTALWSVEITANCHRLSIGGYLPEAQKGIHSSPGTLTFNTQSCILQ